MHAAGISVVAHEFECEPKLTKQQQIVGERAIEQMN